MLIPLYSLLLFSGYLNPSVVDKQKNIYQLSIPNYEVAYIYETRLLEWVSAKLEIDQKAFYSLMQQLATGQVEEFEKQLQEYLIVSTSFYQTGPKGGELFYNGFMKGLLSTLSSAYMIESERESGLGRADTMLIPKPRRGKEALVIEYKVGKKKEDLGLLAQKGLQQIQEKGYGIHLRVHEHVRSLLQVCMAFCGQEVRVAYRRVDL